MTPDAVRTMRDDYLLSHGVCTYCAVVPKDVYPHCNNDRFDLEHIWQRLGSRLDDPCNYVICCRESHEWKHAHSIEGRIAALYWKWTHKEFNRERLKELTGLDPIGWVHNRWVTGLPLWASQLAEQLTKAHE